MDDLVVNPSAELPKVFSPCKVQYVEKNVPQTLPDFYKNLRSSFDDGQNCQATGTNASGSEDSEDSDFADSDYEVEDGDDDLFVDYIDADVVDEGVSKGNKTGRRSAVTFAEGETESSDD